MDFALSEEQKMLQGMARDFLQKECPKSLVREVQKDPSGHPRELWRKMAELGWQGLVVPERYGGTGGSFLDLMVLIEEMGGACLPGPFFCTTVLGALTLTGAGTEEQKRELLPLIARGEAIITMALVEVSDRWDAEGIQCNAQVKGDTYVINGTKLFVPYAHIADQLIVAARTSVSDVPESGITLFLVNRKTEGITITVLNSINADKQCEVQFHDVEISSDRMVGQSGGGWPVIQRTLERATVAKCVEMVGGAQQVLDMTIQYAKERMQFGRPIGSFQAIQHRCADMAIDVDGSRFIAYLAAWKLSEEMPCPREVSIAKSWVSEAYRRVTKAGHQVHGGIGFTLDHDMHLYFRNAKAFASAFGNANWHLNKIVNDDTSTDVI